MEPKPRLRVVDDKGQLHEDQCPNCAGAEKEVRAWRVRYANLKREVDGEFRDHELWPQAVKLFEFWKERCKHPRSKFTPERFEQILPHLRDEGPEICERAIEGAAFDPYTTQARNGSTIRHDSWSLIWRNREKVESFANRAPYHLPSPERVKTLADALAWIYKWEPDRAVAEAQARLK
jgi:hypothetical protein